MTHKPTESQPTYISQLLALHLMPQPVEVARSVELLLGESGRNVTGTEATVDAGNTARRDAASA